MKKSFAFILDEEHVGKRLDAVLAALTGINRSNLKNHLTKLFLNGKVVKLSFSKTVPGDKVDLEVEWIEEKIEPENIPLDIVYEDENYIVVNKPCGMVVHPAKGNYTGTLVHALWGLDKIRLEKKDTENIDELKLRAGIVHRLDKDTSGLIIVARHRDSQEYLSKLFHDRKIKKIYSAVLKGRLLPYRQTVINQIGRNPHNRKKMAVVERGGKSSHSVFHVVRHVGNYSFVKVRIYTGRTHQIRVHAAYLGCPVLGDPLYARSDSKYPDIRLCLAATAFSFFDKYSNKQLTFKIKPPRFMGQVKE
ncbi:MAG: RluA family pseudouridine synthase [Spirochaetales bacterium]|nr:RluA family pseudouridine synthase [Spirochaetales bacterium]